jgi:hypothetical protein
LEKRGALLGPRQGEDSCGRFRSMLVILDKVGTLSYWRDEMLEKRELFD